MNELLSKEKLEQFEINQQQKIILEFMGETYKELGKRLYVTNDKGVLLWSVNYNTSFNDIMPVYFKLHSLMGLELTLTKMVHLRYRYKESGLFEIERGFDCPFDLFHVIVKFLKFYKFNIR